MVTPDVTFLSGHARHDFAPPDPPVLRIYTAWSCADPNSAVQLLPVEPAGEPGIVLLRLARVPSIGFGAPCFTNLTAEYTLVTDQPVRQVLVVPLGISLPVTRWNTANTASWRRDWQRDCQRMLNEEDLLARRHSARPPRRP
jgi:hypothetical protein